MSHLNSPIVNTTEYFLYFAPQYRWYYLLDHERIKRNLGVKKVSFGKSFSRSQTNTRSRKGMARFAGLVSTVSKETFQEIRCPRKRCLFIPFSTTKTSLLDSYPSSYIST